MIKQLSVFLILITFSCNSKNDYNYNESLVSRSYDEFDGYTIIKRSYNVIAIYRLNNDNLIRIFFENKKIIKTEEILFDPYLKYVDYKLSDKLTNLVNIFIKLNLDSCEVNLAKGITSVSSDGIFYVKTKKISEEVYSEKYKYVGKGWYIRPYKIEY